MRWFKALWIMIPVCIFVLVVGVVPSAFLERCSDSIDNLLLPEFTMPYVVFQIVYAIVMLDYVCLAVYLLLSNTRSVAVCILSALSLIMLGGAMLVMSLTALKVVALCLNVGALVCMAVALFAWRAKNMSAYILALPYVLYCGYAFVMMYCIWMLN